MANFKEIRLLRADEISCRVQQVLDYKAGGAGALVMLYKDARTDMSLLDETYGPLNWQRIHTAIDGKMFCTISVWDDEKKQWVSKQDVGVESNMDATKGEASDSFKRSGVNWGIGRELYTSPDMLINLAKSEYKIGLSGKLQTTFSFGLTIQTIEYNNNREISRLVLIDKIGKIRFSHGTASDVKNQPIEAEPENKPVVPADNKPVPVALAAKIARKDEVLALCYERKMSADTFGGMMLSLQQAGQLPNKTTAEMTDLEFADMLVKMRKAPMPQK